MINKNFIMLINNWHDACPYAVKDVENGKMKLLDLLLRNAPSPIEPLKIRIETRTCSHSEIKYICRLLREQFPVIKKNLYDFFKNKGLSVGEIQYSVELPHDFWW